MLDSWVLIQHSGWWSPYIYLEGLTGSVPSDSPLYQVLFLALRKFRNKFLLLKILCTVQVLSVAGITLVSSSTNGVYQQIFKVNRNWLVLLRNRAPISQCSRHMAGAEHPPLLLFLFCFSKRFIAGIVYINKRISQ